MSAQSEILRILSLDVYFQGSVEKLPVFGSVLLLDDCDVKQDAEVVKGNGALRCIWCPLCVEILNQDDKPLEYLVLHTWIEVNFD